MARSGTYELGRARTLQTGGNKPSTVGTSSMGRATVSCTSSGSAKRQRHYESCSAVLWKFRGNAPRVQLHNLPADVEAEPHPCHARERPASMRLVEAIE